MDRSRQKEAATKASPACSMATPQPSPVRRESLRQKLRRSVNSKESADRVTAKPAPDPTSTAGRSAREGDGRKIIKQMVSGDEQLASDKIGDEKKRPREKRKKMKDSNETRKDSQENKWMCEVCGQQLSSKARYNVHARLHTGVKPFHCSFPGCGKCFRDGLLYRRHLRWHKNERRYICEQCGKGYFYKDNLKEHMHVHTDLRPFSCDRCGKGFLLEKSLNRHMAAHVAKKAFQCDQCPSSFAARFVLNAHVKAQHTDLTLCSCPTCGKTFRHRSNLNRHIRWHKKDTRYRCLKCDKAYYFPSELAAHMSSHGLENADFDDSEVTTTRSTADVAADKAAKEATKLLLKNKLKRKRKPAFKKYPCSQCSYSFTGPSTLKNHIKTVHEGQKPFSCQICGKCYTMVGSLNIHMLRHEGKHRFKCDTCEKSFFRKTDLTKHLLLHGPKQFTCKECGSMFRHKQALTVHERVHTGVRPYSCSQCERTFTDSSTYRSHLTTHKDTKDYVCSICDKAYKYSKTLKQHMKSHGSSASQPFSGRLCKPRVDVVVTNSDALVVGTSGMPADKAQSKLSGSVISTLVGNAGINVSSTRLPVKELETSRQVQRQSGPSPSSLAPVSNISATPSVVTVFDPSKSNSPLLSVDLGSDDNTTPLTSQVPNDHLSSQSNPRLSDSPQTVTVVLGSQRSSRPLNLKQVLNANTVSPNDTQPNSLKPDSQQPLDRDSQSQTDLQTVESQTLHLQGGFHSHPRSTQSKSDQSMTVSSSLKRTPSVAGQEHTIANHSSASQEPQSQLMNLHQGEEGQKSDSSLADLSNAATHILGHGHFSLLETDTHIIIIEETQ